MTSVVLIGSTPLPYGGVTVFNSRLAHRLAERRRLLFLLKPKSPLSLAKLLWLRLCCREKYVIYYSAGSVGWFLVFMLLGLLPRVVFFDHNSSRHWAGLNAGQRLILKLCVPRIKQVWVAGAHLAANYRGFFGRPIAVRAFSTFMQPHPGEEQAIIHRYPAALQQALIRGERSLVVCSAYCPVQTTDGQDLYGLIRTSRLFDELAQVHQHLIFVFVIGQWAESSFSEEVRRVLEMQASQRSNVLLLSGNFQLWPLFKKALCLLRPTLTDGDSVSVKEAVFFGATVIASDVAPRPDAAVVVDLSANAYEQAVRHELARLTS